MLCFFSDTAADPEAIDLADEEGDTAMDVDAPASAADAEVVQAAVPPAVFGSVGAAAASAGAWTLHTMPLFLLRSMYCSLGILDGHRCDCYHAAMPAATPPPPNTPITITPTPRARE